MYPALCGHGAVIPQPGGQPSRDPVPGAARGRAGPRRRAAPARADLPATLRA
jgi:hypothetical protein